MGESQMLNLLGKLVMHQKSFEAMSNEDTQWAIKNTKESISMFVEAIKNRNKINLEHFGKEVVYNLSEKFVVKDSFIIKSGIGYINDNFKKLFYGIKEEPIVGTTDIYRYILCTVSSDQDIINKFSGNEDFTVKFSEIFYLIGQQNDGSEGILDTSGKLNIFYVVDVQGKIHEVFVLWDGNKLYWKVYFDSHTKVHLSDMYVFSHMNIS